ncbi:MAG: hypothetical protein IJH84_06840, partial [Saccharopolyspora sp.]|nr:hypothetical protein [Saccharopolyspora sp.]
AAATHALRRRALRSLLQFPPELVPEFFEVFFSLDEQQQAAFLAADHDPAGTVATMSALFRRAPWPIRRRLIAGGFGPGWGRRSARLRRKLTRAAPICGTRLHRPQQGDYLREPLGNAVRCNRRTVLRCCVGAHSGGAGWVLVACESR